MIQEKLAMMYDGKYKGSEEERHTKWTNFIKENQSAHPEIKPATIEALQIPLTR
jgi:hypothetical protein